MNVLTFGFDDRVLDPDSDVHRRQLEYANRLNDAEPGSRLTIVTHSDRGRDITMIDDVLRVIPTNSFSRYTFAAGALRRGLAIDEEIQLVISQAPLDDGLTGRILARRFDAPLLIQHHAPFYDDPNWRSDEPLWPVKVALFKLVVPGADAVRVVSRAAIDWYRERGLPRERIYRLPVSINLPEEVATVDFNASKNVLYAGRLIERKRIGDLISAFDRVASAVDDVALHVVGAGSDVVETRLRRLAAQRGIADQVHFPGYVSRDRLAGYYRGADVFVSPSGLEPYGRVMVEALWQGTPVVASDTVGARDIISEGRWGYIVPKSDLAAFESRITDLLTDPDQAQEMGRRGQQYVRAEHDPDSLRSALVNLWRVTATGDLQALQPTKDIVTPPEEFEL
jgi:glycosyltransferase involved in cell wall biosynthesis